MSCKNLSFKAEVYVNFENSFNGAKIKYLMQICVTAIIKRFSIRINFKKAMKGFLSMYILRQKVKDKYDKFENRWKI